MALICPTVTATDEDEYSRQLRLISSFSKRVHIDLMDGVFAPTTSPSLGSIWWPLEVEVDIHLMFQEPMAVVDQLIQLQPRMVIIHNEAHVHHMHFSAQLHKAGIETGLALLQDTPVEYAYQIMHSFDQVLIFSGHLGYHGGTADLGLLDKVSKVRIHHPEAEIAWDGGINQKNAGLLAAAGVDVLNVGGAIVSAPDPEKAYAILKNIIRH